ncbi:sugar porter family MFS transporter [Methylopila jiangsuensis]|nr:sugar porter family MFS transporter [Methylopila jiangsuensis]
MAFGAAALSSAREAGAKVRDQGANMNFKVVAATASLGGLLFGYDTGVVSGALPFIRDLFQLSEAMQGFVVSIALLGAAAGAAAAGQLADAYGRRKVIIVVAGFFVVGALLCAIAGNVPVLLAGRLILGVAIGVASMLTPLYLAEMAPADKRGSVVSLNQMCITVGILLSYIVAYLLSEMDGGWRWMLAIGCLPGVVLGLGMIALPESPRWLAGQGRHEEAAAALKTLRGGADVSAELAALRTDLTRSDGALVPWSALLEPRVRIPLIVGVGLAVFQQVTGINTVIYYAPIIFEKAGMASTSAAILATAGVGVVNVAMTYVALKLLDTAGRRKLLLIGLAGMAAMLAVLTLGFAIGTEGPLAWIATLSVAAYVGFFAIGLGPVFWLLISEIFPLAVRGRAMGVATVANWGSNLIVSQVFLMLIAGVGSAATFGLFAVMTVAALAFTFALVPETKGRTLEEIEASFAETGAAR